MCSVFKTETHERAAEIQADFPVFQENLYETEVFDIKVVEMQDTDWSSGHPVKTEKMIDSVEVTLKLIKSADGEAPKFVDGKDANKDLVKFWFDPLKMGFNRKTKEPTKGRQFLTAVQNLDGNAPLTLADLETEIESLGLIGEKVKCLIAVIEREDGTKKNSISRFSAANVSKKKQ